MPRWRLAPGWQAQQQQRAPGSSRRRQQAVAGSTAPPEVGVPEDVGQRVQRADALLQRVAARRLGQVGQVQQALLGQQLLQSKK